MKDRCGNLGGKMSGPLVSIVVPVYNVESYIEECLQSVCSQTYENLEIIWFISEVRGTRP